MNWSHARQGMKGCNFGVLDVYCKKEFQSQAYFRNDLLGFQPWSIFSVWCFQSSPSASGRKLEVIVWSLKNVVPLDPLPVFHHHLETKNMVNIHSLHNERIPLNLIDCREHFIAANAKLCISGLSPRLHSGASSFGEPRSWVPSSEHLCSPSNTHTDGPGCFLATRKYFWKC